LFTYLIPDTQLRLGLSLSTPIAREVLLQRWSALVNDILPKMASQHHWPISQNHCFMRVCLDKAVGSPWHNFVKRPASRHMTDNQLRSAIAVAEQVVEAPALLPELNRQSIEYRESILSIAAPASKYST
jgi:hypothetical protein